jgi:transitional endoplasmic reticulum ATPase
MKLKAKIINEQSCPWVVFISSKNCKVLGLNPDALNEFERMVKIEDNVNPIWQPVFTKQDVGEDEIFIPQQVAVNLPDLVDGALVNVEKWSIEGADIIKTITLEKKYPENRSLSSKRTWIGNMVRNITFPLAVGFSITVPIKLADGEIIQSVFLVRDFKVDNPVSIRAFRLAVMPLKREDRERITVEVKIVNLGTGDEEASDIKGFQLVGGLEKEIQKVRELLELPFEYPGLYSQIGIKPGKGILLEGPPGTGKTLIARAVAQTTRAKFIKLNAAELFSEFAGKAEEKLRHIFEEAEQAERAIIFIDEIDALAVKRDAAQEDFTRRLVGQFLPLLDGIENDGRVVVIGATNRPASIDPAFRRPGRFDREITIGIPDQPARFEILKIHTRNMKLEKDVDIEKLAEKSHGYVGADLEALCREAGIHALNRYIQWEINEIKVRKENDIVVSWEDFDKVIKEFTPSTLRNIRSNVPKIDWETDIIGLHKAKEILLDAIEMPFRKFNQLKPFKINSSNETLILGESGGGKKTLVYALANKLGMRCLTIDLLRMMFKESDGVEDLFYRLIQLAVASKPCILLFANLDDELNALLDKHILSRVINGFCDFFDMLGNTDHIFTIITSKSRDSIPASFFKLGRFDQLINIPRLTTDEQMKLLSHYFPKAVDDEQVTYFLKTVRYHSPGELIYLAKRCVLAMLKNGWRSKNQPISESLFNESVDFITTNILEAK